MISHINFYNYKQFVLDDKNCSSHWLQEAVRALEQRDVCDVLKDIETLKEMFRMRLKEETARYSQLASLIEDGKA
jgi:hypothetical protein